MMGLQIATARIFYVIAAALIIIAIVASRRSSNSPLFTKPLGPTTYINTLPPAWPFDTERDANNYGLTSDQCSIAFPGLYNEIDRVVQRRRSKPITKAELTREKWPAG